MLLMILMSMDKKCFRHQQIQNIQDFLNLLKRKYVLRFVEVSLVNLHTKFFSKEYLPILRNEKIKL